MKREQTLKANDFETINNSESCLLGRNKVEMDQGRAEKVIAICCDCEYDPSTS